MNLQAGEACSGSFCCQELAGRPCPQFPLIPSQIASLTLACWNPHTRALLIGPFILATPPNNKGPAPG